MTVTSYATSAPVSTVPSPVHPHTGLDPIATVRRWAAQRDASYTEVFNAVRYYAHLGDEPSPYLAAVTAAAESLAMAERIAAAVAHAGMRQWEPNHVSTTGGVTQYTYKFAPSSHKSKRVKHCRICEKRGRERCPHHKNKAIA